MLWKWDQYPGRKSRIVTYLIYIFDLQILLMVTISMKFVLYNFFSKRKQWLTCFVNSHVQHQFYGWLWLRILIDKQIKTASQKFPHKAGAEDCGESEKALVMSPSAAQWQIVIWTLSSLNQITFVNWFGISMQQAWENDKLLLPLSWQLKKWLLWGSKVHRRRKAKTPSLSSVWHLLFNIQNCIIMTRASWPGRKPA